MDPKGGGQAHRYRSSIERHGQGGRRLSMKEMPRKTSAPNAYSTGTWSSATVRLVARRTPVTVAFGRQRASLTTRHPVSKKEVHAW